MKKLMTVGLALAAFACTAQPVTKALFFFDTEEYTDPSNSDPIVSIASLLTEEGVRGHFEFVGYLAKKLVDWRRTDVIGALKPHLIGTQTLYHSLHPNINEKTDIADFDEAYRRAAADEWRSLGMILAALEALETGTDDADFTTRGKWRYAEDYEDRYLSDRLRLQLWTLRYER